MTEETMVRIMVYEIRERNPAAVGFVPDQNAMKTIVRYLAERRLDMILYCYGITFLLEMLRLFEEAENFEMCAEILSAIEEHNSTVRESLPTRI